MTKLCVV